MNDYQNDNFEIPSDWGRDKLSEFIEAANHNTIATFVNCRQQYDVLVEINKLYWKIVDNLGHSPEFVASFFVIRSHCSFLGGVRLGLSGQISEAYMCLRGCLESSLYGLYISDNEERQKVWLNRHEDEKCMSQVRREFSTRNIMNHLGSFNDRKQEIAQMLYERTIDLGAHPNERSALAPIEIRREGSKIYVKAEHLLCGNIQQELCIKSASQIGVCSLDIIYHIYPERFQKLQIDEGLSVLKRGL